MKIAKVSFIGWPLFWAALTTVLAPLAAGAATISTIAKIPGYQDGGLPYRGLVRLHGKYYGTTGGGGAYGDGTFYSIDLKTGVDTVIHSFNGADGQIPYNLVASGGKFYGSTIYGGTQGSGTIFEIDPTTGTEQVIFDIPYETYIGVSLEYRGLLYGAGQCGSGASCIYSFDPVADTGQIVFTLDNAVEGSGVNGLTLRGQFLYGTTTGGGAAGGGTLFRFDPANASARVEHVFGKNTDGSQPSTPLIDVGGLFYGATTAGGDKGDGTVFSFNPDMRQEVVLHSFTNTNGGQPIGLVSEGSLLFGVTSFGGTAREGVLFSLDPATGTTTVIHDFGYPHADENGNLVEANGLLYGTLRDTGAAGAGEVYSIDPSTGAFATVHSFAGQESSTTSGVIKVGGALYGTASGGGTNDLGSIYKVDLKTGAIETVHSFNGLDGARPVAALVDIDGVLYGTTSIGGPTNAGPVSSLGTIFSFEPAKRTLTTLYQFNNEADGGNPVCALSVVNGALYGTTQGSIGASFGNVFKLDIATGTFSNVYTGSRNTEVLLSSGVVSVNGLLYGEAISESGSGGFIYQLDPATAAFSTLYAFQGGADGTYAVSGLLDHDGSLWGLTEKQSDQAATAFRFDLLTATKSTLHTFAQELSPMGPLASSGNRLFGTATSKAAPYGAVLRLNATDGATHVFPFAGASGGYPMPPLLHVGAALYGTTRSSDASNAGTVFKFVP